MVNRYQEVIYLNVNMWNSLTISRSPASSTQISKQIMERQVLFSLAKTLQQFGFNVIVYSRLRTGGSGNERYVSRTLTNVPEMRNSERMQMCNCLFDQTLPEYTPFDASAIAAAVSLLTVNQSDFYTMYPTAFLINRADTMLGGVGSIQEYFNMIPYHSLVTRYYNQPAMLTRTNFAAPNNLPRTVVLFGESNYMMQPYSSTSILNWRVRQNTVAHLDVYGVEDYTQPAARLFQTAPTNFYWAPHFFSHFSGGSFLEYALDSGGIVASGIRTSLAFEDFLVQARRKEVNNANNQYYFSRNLSLRFPINWDSNALWGTEDWDEQVNIMNFLPNDLGLLTTLLGNADGFDLSTCSSINESTMYDGQSSVIPASV